MVRTIFQENFKKYIDMSNTSILSLASITNISRQSIYNVLSGKHDVRLSTALKIARSLNIDFIELNSFNANFSKEFDVSASDTDYLSIMIQNIKRSCASRTQKSLSTIPGLSEAEVSNILAGKVTNPYMGSLEAMLETTNFIDLAQAMKRR